MSQSVAPNETVFKAERINFASYLQDFTSTAQNKLWQLIPEQLCQKTPELARMFLSVLFLLFLTMSLLKMNAQSRAIAK